MDFDLQQELVIATVIGAEGLPAGLVGCKKIYSCAGGLQTLAGNINLPWLEAQLAGPVAETLASGTFVMATTVNPEQPEQTARVMIDPYLEPHELIILGTGHIAYELVRFGRALGYKLTVIDDRPDVTLQGCLSGDDRSICCSFDAIEEVLTLGPRSHVVIVTRGHLHDLECLRRVIKYPLGYVGMIGSRRKVQLVQDTLRADGVDSAKIESVHMPIGLDIGAQTPAEIAVSIAAELVMVRRGGSRASIGAGVKRGKGGEMITAADRDTVRRAMMAAREGTPVAMATVVSAQGSTPRKAGAKMLVYPDGHTCGTIGGGCAEAEVRLMALTVIETGKADIYRISMSADIAAQEGMACGGELEVFVELVKNFTIIV